MAAPGSIYRRAVARVDRRSAGLHTATLAARVARCAACRVEHHGAAWTAEVGWHDFIAGHVARAEVARAERLIAEATRLSNRLAYAAGIAGPLANRRYAR